MKRLAFFLLTIGLLGCTQSAPEEVGDGGPHFEITKLRDGVYAAMAIPGRHAVSNSGIIDMGGDKIIIFDTGLTPEVGRLLKESAESLIEGKVFIVINSNFESDHVRGNQVFQDEATIVGTTRSQVGVNETEPQRLAFEKEHISEFLQQARADAATASTEQERQDYALRIGYLEALESSKDEVVPTAPTLVWDQKLNFNGKARRVKIIPFGQAVTESDAALYLEGDSLLFSSDLLVVDRHPSLQNSYLPGWRAALDSLDLLTFKEVIPGHGPITDRSAIDQTRAYIDMIETLATEVAEGKADADEITPSPPFDKLLRTDRFSPNLKAVAATIGSTE